MNGTAGKIWPSLQVEETEIKNCGQNSGVALYNENSKTVIINCYIHDNLANGVLWKGNQFGLVLIGSIFANNGGGASAPYNAGVGNDGSVDAAFLIVEQCAFANNVGSGIQMGPASGTGGGYISIKNSIFWGNGGYGINLPLGVPQAGFVNRNNAYGSNTSGARNNFPAGVSDVTLTADPFLDAAGGDYSLNDVAGGGNACRGTGYQWGV